MPSARISNTTPHTTYKMWVTAKNAIGTGETGGPVEAQFNCTPFAVIGGATPDGDWPDPTDPDYPIRVSSFTGDGTIGEADQPYDVYEFLGTGTLEVTTPGIADVMVLAGGAGGGSGETGGGGGAGGFWYGTIMLEKDETVIVGSGGGTNANGNDSQIGVIVSTKGGGTMYQSGGSGGGNRGGGPGDFGGGGVGKGTVIGEWIQGTGGGYGNHVNQDACNGGGGGGAGHCARAQSGGDGRESTITGVATTYGGGGGAHARGRGQGSGGAGGGGDALKAGSEHLGGGGGTRNKGGSGRVIVRVKVSTPSFGPLTKAVTPKTAHAARIEDGVVRQVIAIPQLGDDDAKITEYCNRIGLPGTWVDTSYTGRRRGKYAGLGDTFAQTKSGGEFVSPTVDEVLDA